MSDHFDKTREGAMADRQVDGVQQFLTFTIGDEEYGVDIMTVREIKGWTEITRLPNTPDFMRGVMNLRGLIIPIFDLRMRFGRGQTSATEKHVVIILAVENRNIGILVDAVSDILNATADQIKHAPSTESKGSVSYIDGLISLEGRMAVLLNVAQLLESEIPEVHTGTAA